MAELGKSESLAATNMGRELQAIACQLMLHCHVAVPGVYKLPMPQYIRTMERLSLTAVKPNERHREIKDFMASFFSSFKGTN